MLWGISYTYLWLALAVVLAVVEAATLGIATIWFAAGALLAMVAAAIGLPLYVQCAVFFVASALLLYYTRPIMKKYLKIGRERTNADRMIGETGIVIETLDAIQGKGQVKVLGQVWSARSSDQEAIEVGEKVKVLDISGVRLIVKKLENNKTEGEM